MRSGSRLDRASTTAAHTTGTTHASSTPTRTGGRDPAPRPRRPPPTPAPPTSRSPPAGPSRPHVRHDCSPSGGVNTPRYSSTGYGTVGAAKSNGPSGNVPGRKPVVGQRPRPRPRRRQRHRVRAHRLGHPRRRRRRLRPARVGSERRRRRAADRPRVLDRIQRRRRRPPRSATPTSTSPGSSHHNHVSNPVKPADLARGFSDVSTVNTAGPPRRTPPPSAVAAAAAASDLREQADHARGRHRSPVAAFSSHTT